MGDDIGIQAATNEFRWRASTPVLCGVSMLALLAGMVVAAPSFGQAVTVLEGAHTIVFNYEAGPAGINASNPIFSSNRYAGPGGGGPSWSYLNRGSISQFVFLHSLGGQGGNGAGSSLSPREGGGGGNITFTQAGTIATGGFLSSSPISITSQGGAGGAHGGYSSSGNGGVGGAVSFTHDSGKISGSANSSTGSSLLWLQSLGGAGANGLARTQATEGTTYSYLAATAGAGGAAGSASATINAEIAAEGQGFAAVRVSTVGGASGQNGASRNSARSLARGGTGGAASVDIGKDGKVSTVGDRAPGVIVEARGGDGGKAGVANDVRGTDGGGFADSITNPSVRLVNRGSVTTNGARSSALMAQSVGGNGGAGNSTGSTGSASRGGDGGAGGAVVVEHSGTISTGLDNSYGIVAQSVGGSGGKGGNGGVWGADGGRAGDGGTVLVTNAGSIETKAQGSTAIVAQSIGGGKALDAFNAILPSTRGGSIGPGGGDGGSGGFLFFGSGGEGGGGGAGGLVDVRNAGSITTTQSFAYGILAQSIGGGGGDGGVARSLGTFAGVALGGGGGGGGNGGAVKVSAGSLPAGAKPSITTYGDEGIAIFAQSVGGSGGVGGSATAETVGVVGAVSVAIGGNGGKGGHGGTVEVDNSSTISTGGSDAIGIFAQSIGGGGGRSGDTSTYAVAVSPPGWPAISVSTSIGGSGGDGGNGNTVTVTNRAAITTSGTSAYGIQAQSVGGGGGAASSAISTSDMISMTGNIGVPVTIGGSGGGGGNGGEVSVTNKAKITTGGEFAFGISAASIGGGGGSGGSIQTSSKVGLSWESTIGSSANDSVNEIFGILPTADSISANVGVGGRGGDGGFGRQVTVTNESEIHTKASNTTAIFAQSIGGGGGSGGGFLGNGSSTLKVDVNVGGRGGKGGAGGDVTVKNLKGASILTDQAGSHGIYAQSVGGGGGVGGGFTGEQKSFSGVNLKNGMALLKELLDVKKIYGTLTKPTTEEAKNAAAIAEWRKVATGGEYAKQVTISETFKAGKNLLKTILDKDKSLEEKLARSAFVVGLAAAKIRYREQIKDLTDKLKDKNALDVPSVSVDVNVGGKGGIGGKGGDVTAENAGNITTKGKTSFGIFAQSVGGGGGAGGAAYASGDNRINVKVTVGGGGNDAGEGGTVKATNAGSIATSGGLAYGILAQSVGGGGGIGGASANGDTLSISANVVVGGSSGKSSKGGVVEVRNTGKITTTGSEAHAIVAQSIGGGGGVFYVHQADPTKQAEFIQPPTREDEEALKEFADILKRLGVDPVPAGDATYNKDATILPKPALNVNIGGDGGAGGSGDSVSVFHGGGTIRTEGAASFGIFAQSLGGGGGLGGSAGGSGLLQVGYGLGGKGGTAGQGGAVTVTLGGGAKIETLRENAMAIFAQSIGGGGGYGGNGEVKSDLFSPSRAQVSDGGASGNGGLVTVKMDPTTADASMSIETGGTGAHGIYAQSLGGGGGLVLSDKLIADRTAIGQRTRALGKGGEIVINTRGTIETTGANAYGIFAQSGVQKTDGSLDASRTGGNIKITHSGTIKGGKERGGAIRVDGGADNLVTIVKGSEISASSNTAITGTFGRETVDNYGTVIGAIDLAQGGSPDANVFNNRAGGTYRSVNGQGDIRVGPKGDFNDEGNFDIGGTGTIGSAKVVGNYYQTTGKMLVDIADPAQNGGRANDHLQVEGSAVMRGQVEPRASWLLPGDYRVLSATNYVGGIPVVSGAQANSVAIRWGVGFAGPGGTDHGIALTPKADFVNVKGAEFSDDQRKVARYLQSGWDARAQGMGTTFPRFLTTNTQSAYAAALDEMTSESAQYAANGKIAESRNALRFSMSCPAFMGSGTLLQEGECVWGRIGGSRSRMSASTDEGGYRQNDLSYRIGGQKEFAPNWFIGGTASYTRSELKDPDGLTGTDSVSYDVSIALKHQVGNWLFAASGTIGKSDQEHLRAITIGTTGGRSRADSELYSAGARFRAAYEFAFENWYARPYLDLDVLHLQASSYAETGALGLDLAIRGQRKTLFAVNPNLEIGGRFELGTGYWVRPFGSVGFTLLSSDSYVTRASLVGAPAAIGSFETSSRIPDKLLDLGLGVQISSGAGFEVTGEYQAQVGKDYLSHTGSARLSWRF